MSCGVIADFRSGTVGFIRMELWAGKVQNSLIRTEIGQICPATVQQLKRF
jgi:hypothetical protein